MEPSDAYRNELSAALARVEALTQENKELRAGIVRSRIRQRIGRWIIYWLVAASLSVTCLGYVIRELHSPMSHAGMTRGHAQALRNAAALYREGHSGACPSVVALLRAKFIVPSEPPDSSNSPLDIRDSWDSPFDIQCEDDDVLVVSAGPDRRWDTPDDLRVPGPALE